jgi:hypothetical protein
MIDIQDESENRVSSLSRNNVSLPNIEYSLHPELYQTLDPNESMQRTKVFQEKRKVDRIPLPEAIRPKISAYREGTNLTPLNDYMNKEFPA